MLDPILVDTDPALGLPFADVDDALAIFALVAAKAPIVGLTSCYGNAPLARTHAIATELGQRFGLPVHRGASRPGDCSTAAVDTLVRHRGIVLAIAPLTNVAAALARGARWSKLVILGGTFGRTPNLRPLHTTEFNLALDLDAAAMALPACTTLVTMDVCCQVLFSERDLAPLPGWLRSRCRGWLRLSPLMTGRRAFHPWDVLAALFLLRPDLFRIETRSIGLRAGRLCRGHLGPGPWSVQIAAGVVSDGLRLAWATLAGGPS